jgi:hypothetical protein
VSIRRSGTLLFQPAPGNFRRVGQPFWSIGNYQSSGVPCDVKESLRYLLVVFHVGTVEDRRSQPTATYNPLDVAKPVPPSDGCFDDASGL